MYEFKPTRRSVFNTPSPADRPLRTAPLADVLPIRDRVALGYYDRPDLTEATVNRMLMLLSADLN